MKNRSLHAVLTRFGIIAAVLATLVFIAPAASAAAQKYSVEENTTDPIARFAASDEEGDEITWSVDGDDKGDFEISEAGVLSFKEKPNFESPADEDKNNVYKVTVVAAGESKANQDVEVTVTDVDEAGKVTFSGLGRYQPQVGRSLSASQSDPDGDVTEVTWQWSRGPNVDGPWTDIAKATSADRTPTADDVDNYLRATATYNDKFNTGTTKASVSAVSENAVEAKTLSNAAPDFSDYPDSDDQTTGLQVAREVDENAKGANVGKPLVAKDGDNDVLHYTLADGTTEALGNNNDIDELTLFSIDERTGQITTKKEIDSNAGDDNDTDTTEDTYSVIVTATDPSGASGMTTVVITINNINDVPKFAKQATGQNNNAPKATVVENTTNLDDSGNTTNAPNYVATDDDADEDTFTFAVTGADASKFFIPEGGGNLAFCSTGDTGNAAAREDDACTAAHTPDYEKQSSYSITITATDASKGVGKVDVTVSVTNANDAGTVKLSMREPQIGRPVTASLSDPDGSISGVSWQWRRAGSALGSDEDCRDTGVGGTWADIEDAESPTYTPVEADKDRCIEASVSYTDKIGATTAALKTEADVQESDPANTAPKFADDNDANTPGDQPDVERSVAENAKGATVGDPVTADDADGDLRMYTIGGADASSFSIGRDDGQIKTAEGLNYEVKDSYTIVVTATDPSGATDTINVNVTVTDADDKGVITGDKTYTIDENTTALGSYLATDEDGDAIEWGVSGDDSGKFSISDTGVLTFKDKPSYEANASADDDNVYKVKVTANKGDLAVEVTVEDVDEDGKVTLDKPQPQVDRTITASGADSDPDKPVTDAKWQWSSGPSANGPWTDIAKATSASRTPKASDVGLYLRATVTYNDKFADGQTASAVTENAVEARTLANAAPSFSHLDDDNNGTTAVDGIQVNRAVDENKKGENVGKPVAAKDDDGDVLLYTLSTATGTQTDSTEFKIDSRSGQITTLKALDANPAGDDTADRSVTVYVTATDPSGADKEQVVTITVRDVNDAPTFTGYDHDNNNNTDNVVPKTLHVTEIATPGNTITDTPGKALRISEATSGANAAPLPNNTYAADDDDGDTAFTYSLEGADKAKFHISNAGVLTVCTADTNSCGTGKNHDPNYEKQSSYSITIVASDDDPDSTDDDDDVATVKVDVTVKVVDAEDAGTVKLNRREPQVGQSVVASLSDPDGSIKGVTWQWYWDDTATASDTTDFSSTPAACTSTSTDLCTITGATSPSYTPTRINAGNDNTTAMFLTARASYTDGVVTDSNNDGTADKDFAHKSPERDVQIAAADNTAPEFPSDTDPNTDGKQDTYEFSVDENKKGAVASNTLHSVVEATDTDLLLYSLSGADADSFEIVSGIDGPDDIGQIKTAVKLDYETKSSYTVVVTATDPSGATDSITVNISVNDLDDAPTISVVPGGAPEPTHPCIVGGATTDEQGADLANDCQILLDAAPVLIGEGSATLNWSADTPIADWDGVASGTGRVTGIYLPGGNARLGGGTLAGTIPAGLNGLDMLSSLTLRNNDLSGAIPDLSDLDNLKRIVLSNNGLTGGVPATLGDLDNIERIHLQGNSLTGEIPTELADASRLVQLRLHHNDLTGEIPSGFGALERLRYFMVHDNGLTGEIPSDLGNARNMKAFYVNNNALTGEIPASLGGMVDASGKTVRLLYLHNNDLTGDVPSELSALVSMVTLYVAGNDLTGCIPSAGWDNGFAAAKDAAAAGLSECE